MTDYLFEFEAHIDERKRPEGFPKSVFVKEQYQGLDDEKMVDLYNGRVKTMVMNPGLVVFPENKIIDSSKITFDQRIFVPWHMITHFHGRVVPLTPMIEGAPIDSLIPANPVITDADKKGPIQ
jgi:hypothetical protein